MQRMFSFHSNYCSNSAAMKSNLNVFCVLLMVLVGLLQNFVNCNVQGQNAEIVKVNLLPPAAFLNLSSTPTTHTAPPLRSIIKQSVDNLSFLQQQQQQQQRREMLQQLSQHNFLVGIASIGAQYENASATKCGKELEILLNAIWRKELWSLKVLDSFGHAPKTFNWGNYFWFPSKELCVDLNSPYSITFSKKHSELTGFMFNVTSPFPMRFDIVYMNFSTPHYIDLKLPFENFIHIGLCLPASCTQESIARYTREYFESGVFETQRDFKIKMEPFDIKEPKFSWSYFKQTGNALFFSILFLVILCFIQAESLYKSKENLFKQQEKLYKATTTTTQVENCATTTTTASATTTKVIKTIIWENCTLGEKLLLCFRFEDNFSNAIKEENSKSFVSAIAGLRTIICLWVTVFHVYYYSLYALSNAAMLFAKLEDIAFQPIMQACFYVDVFFVISAFLLVYNFLSNENRLKRIQHNNFKQNLKLFLKDVLYRYLRLTPVMIITMLLSDMATDFLNMFSPFHLGAHSGFYCKSTWWYNLLYIHNFLNMDDICCSWTWYLACEMQYFVLFTALLYVYAKNQQFAKIIFATLAAVFVIAGWLCNYRNGITFQIDVIYSTLNELYVKFWVRIIPYIGGAAMGWMLHRLRQDHHLQQQQQQNRQRQHEHAERQFGHEREHEYCEHGCERESCDRVVALHAVWRVAFWLLCIVLYVFTNFMSYWRTAPSWLVAIIMSFGKLLFALCVGGVIIMCALRRGGRLNALLSMRPFLFLNKFCFSIYMVCPVIVIGVFGLRNEATNFTEVGSALDFLAIVLLSIISAFLLVLLLELPMQGISNVLLRNAEKRSNSGKNSCNGIGSNLTERREQT